MVNPIELGLPHREPFLFIDSVQEHVPGERATCVKTFSGEEAFFAGHFPGNPIVPGVILTEALAQAAGIAGSGTDSNSSFLLSAIRNMKFPDAAKPGETITLVAVRNGEMANLVMFGVEASVGKKQVAVGSLMLNVVG